MVSTRRSAKLRQVFRGNYPPGDSEDCDSEETSSGIFTARRHNSGLSGKGVSEQGGKQHSGHSNTGKLSRLPDMPLDILYEIFSFAHPMDLIHMSWASKAFHIVLTNKYSRRVWVAAFRSIPENQLPPPCPEDLSEVGYANLLYSLCCAGCGTPPAPAYWTARIRLCTDCIKDWVTVVGGAHDQDAIVPSRGNPISPSLVSPTVSIRIRPLSKRLLYVFTKGLRQLVADLESTDDQPVVIQQYKDALVAKGKFARALALQEEMGKVGKGALLAAARDGRISQILERLTDEGWGKELLSHRKDYTRNIINLQGAYVARPLTAKAWEKMEGQILEKMWRCRKRIEDSALDGRCTHRVDKMRTVVQEYQRTLDPHDFYLQVADICRIYDLRKVIVDGTDEEFNACTQEVTSGLPDLTSQIREERAAKISALLPFNGRQDDAPSLATAWFMCRSCNQYKPMHGTDALRHPCLTPWNRRSRKPTDDTTPDLHEPAGLRQHTETTRFTFSEAASAIARGLILDCGEDPESITLAEINSKLHRFVFFENGQLTAHSWKETVNYKHSYSSGYHRFLRPDECPEFVHDPDAYNEKPSWGCLSCWRHGSLIPGVTDLATLPTVKQHIITEHGVDAPTEGVNYFFLSQHRPPKFVRIDQEPALVEPPL